MRRVIRVTLVIWMSLGSWAGPARARGTRLIYLGTACSAAELSAAFVALTGRDPLSADGDLVVGVMVEGGASSLRAVLLIAGARLGVRRIEAASCQELSQALAFLIDMGLDAPAPRRSPESAPAAPPREVQALAPRRPSAVPVRFSAISAVTVSDRLWPRFYMGAQARRHRLSGSLEIAADLPDSMAVSPGQITIQRGIAVLSTCLHCGAFAGCVTLGAGVLRGRGEDFMEARAAAMPIATAGGRLTWERALTGRLRLQARAEAGGSLTRNSFLIEDRVVWSGRRFEGQLGIGAIAQFP